MADSSTSLCIAYFAHTLRSDWNNGNAHFLRGLMRALQQVGHRVTVFEPESEWSIENLRTEALGEKSLAQFAGTYADLNLQTYSAVEESDAMSEGRLANMQIVIMHEWNPPALAQRLLALRDKLGFRLLFHDTHHRASSSPEQMELYGLQRFDGILAFGEALRKIYLDRFGFTRVWTLHEAADTSVFHPGYSSTNATEAVWIGNWGEDERAAEIRTFYLEPAAALAPEFRFSLYGVRFPRHALDALGAARVEYNGYLPNLDAPAVYSGARLTVHIPRQQYSSAMTGIPTIRVFEALACGIPLISAPWQDTEKLFNPGDFLMVRNTAEMVEAMRFLLVDRAAAEAQAHRGLGTIIEHHTCVHRAHQLTGILQEVLA